jgi:phage/plasmid-associated DNA primase
MANQVPAIEPYDEAVDARVKVVQFTKQFVKNVVDDETQLKMDPEIVEEIRTPELQNAFLKLLMTAYSQYRMTGEVEPPEVNQGKQTYIETEDSDLETFFSVFEVTGNDGDTMKSSEMKEWVTSNGLKITARKLLLDVNKHQKKDQGPTIKCGEEHVQGTASTKVRVWKGLKYANNY